MAVHLFNVGRTRVVAGLEWTEAATDARADVRAAARREQTRFGAPFEVLSTRDVRTFVGLAKTAQGTRAKGAVSAAAWLAKAAHERGRMIYCERLDDDRFWLLAVGPDSLDPRTDTFLESHRIREELDTVLGDAISDRELGDYQIYTPARDQLPQSNMLDRFAVAEATFADLVENVDVRGVAQVRQLYGVTPAMIAVIVVGAIFLVVGFAGVTLWQKRQREIAQAAQYRQMKQSNAAAQRQAIIRQARIAEAVAQALKKDTATPAPTALIKHCMKAADTVGEEVAGWRVETMDCNPDKQSLRATLVFKDPRNGGYGTSETLKHAAQRRFAAQPVFDMENNRAVIEIPLTAQSKRKALAHEAIQSLDTVVVVLSSYLQKVRQASTEVTYKLTNPKQRSITYLEPGMEDSSDPRRFKEVPQNQGYRRGSIQVMGKNLWQLASLRINWPGVAITKLAMSAHGIGATEWRLEATYVTR
jgi:hypothetical protein